MQTKSLQLLVVVLVVGLSVLFLFGCAHSNIANGPCQELDWYEIGRADGAKGLSTSTLRQIKPVCPATDESLAEALYQNGYDGAISSYCTYRQGFQAGLAGQPVKVDRCPPLLRDDFTHGLTSGQRFAELQKNRKTIASRLQSLNQSLHNRALALPRRAILHGQKLKLEEKIKAVQREIASIQKERSLN